MADVAVINKTDAASPFDVRLAAEGLRAINSRAVIVRAASPIRLDDGAAAKGKRVLGHRRWADHDPLRYIVWSWLCGGRRGGSRCGRSQTVGSARHTRGIRGTSPYRQRAARRWLRRHPAGRAANDDSADVDVVVSATVLRHNPTGAVREADPQSFHLHRLIRRRTGFQHCGSHWTPRASSDRFENADPNDSVRSGPAKRLAERSAKGEPW
jgi:hypothetical protein